MKKFKEWLPMIVVGLFVLAIFAGVIMKLIMWLKIWWLIITA